MSQAPRIIGLALVRNEERFITWALRNVLDFCDELIVLDNGSTDRTGERLAALAVAYPKLRVYPCEDPNRSHRFVEEFAGRPVWIFGVDGDEIYDPEGLARLRPRILGGAYDPYWRIDGHMMNPLRLSLDEGVAAGTITPTAPMGTKLYNFGAIDSWKEDAKERLHGRGMRFRPGYSRTTRCALLRREAWEGCDLRALHLCFFPRTPEDDAAPALRPNPSELAATGVRAALERARNFLARPFAGDPSYKTRRYLRGPIVRREVRAFGRPRDHAAFDPQAEEAEQVLVSSWAARPSSGSR